MIRMRRFAAQIQMLSLVLGTSLGGYCCVAQSTSTSTCLSYEPAVVKVTGTLTRKTFPGLPNYQSARKGDRPETFWLVELAAPVCVSEDKADPDLNPSQESIGEIQLVLDPELYKANKALMGGRVIVQGTLFGAHTGHHHTPVLLTVKAIEAAKH